MKTKLLFCLIILSFMFTAKSARAITYTWSGLGGNSNWNNNANWLPFTGHPLAADIAQIGVAAFGGTQPTINAAGLSCTTLTIGNATVVTLTVSNSFTVSGAITINGNATITGGSTLTGGSLTVNAVTLNLNTPLSLGGAFTAASGSTVNSNLNGTIAAASMAITVSTFTLAATNTLTGALTINNGNTTYNSTALTTAASMTTGTGTLALGGALNIAGNITVGGTTINGSAAATITTTGGGQISLTSATVTLNGVLTSSGVVQVPSPGGTACILTTNAVGNSLSGGIYDHTGSDLTWNGSGTSTCSQGDVSSGQTLTIGSGNTINFTGSVTLHAAAIDGNLVNNGNITMTNASLASNNLGAGATTPITNNAGGTITLTGASAQLSAGTFTNISNSGTITAGASTNINVGGNATLTNNSGGAVNLTGATMSFSASASLNNTGNISAITASTITTANPGTITNNSGGLIALTASSFTLNGAGTLTNSGTITASSASTITTNNPTTFTNNSTGIVTLTASGLTYNGGTTVTNSGAINANAASTITANNPVPITNSSTGTISLSASALTLNGGSNITNAGAVSASLGSTVTFSNPSFINNTTITSSLNVSASTLNLGAGSSITNSGTFTTSSASTVELNGNPTTITNNVNSTFTATSTTITMVAGSAITNTGGTVSLTSSSISCSGNPSTITNQNSGATTGTFTLNATPVTFAGTNSIVNYGTFTANNVSPITMTAAGTSSAITNYGTFFAGTSNSPANITLLGNQPKINNSSTVVAGVTYDGQFYIGSTSILYPTSANCLVTNSANCTFVLQSDAFGSAAIGPVPVGANPSPSLTGTFNVERYFQGSATYDNVKNRWLARNYRIISSPVNIATNTKVSGNNVFGLNYIVGATAGLTTTANSATNAFITGCTGGSSSAGNPSIYLYRESITPNNATFISGNFLGITNITNSTTTILPLAGTITASDGGTYSMPVGTGVLFFFRGAATNWATRTVPPFIQPENVTLTSTGALNQGQITVKDWYTPLSANLAYTVTAGNAAVRGFNMVGNPYPCSIDWNTAFAATGITRTNINPTIWVFNPVTNQYDTYLTTASNAGTSNGGGTDGAGNATNIIASGQGFFVQAVPGGASLVFNETAKSAASQPTGNNLLMGTPVAQSPSQLLRLRLVIDTLNYDDIVIGFNSNASAKYNGTEDAEYLPGVDALEGLSSYSSDSVRLSINFLPLPKLSPQVIRLDAEAGVTGLYKFQKTALDAIPQIYEIWLMDNYKKDSLDIRNNSTYAFNVDLTNTNSYGKNRFQLVIRQNPALAIHLLNFTDVKATDGAQAIWKTENEQNYTNFTVERSSDGGVTFNVLGGFVSSALGSYSFLDTNPPVGADKYRLKIEDMNGTISYSNIVTLIYGNSDSTIPSNISVYPNPASSVLNLAINQNSDNQSPGLSALQKLSLTPGINPSVGNPSFGIKIISTTGSVIKSANSSQPTWQDNISSLVPGTYIIQVVNNSDNSVVGKSTFVKL